MSDALNTIDTLLQATSPRLLAPLNGAIVLDTTTPIFHVTTGGVADPTSITFTARLLELEGTVSFSAVGGTLTSISGNTCVLLASNMPGATATVTAQLTYRGTLFSTSVSLSKVVDGSTGSTGSTGATGDRGAGTFYATGGSWSDATANAATPGANVTDDVVIISDGSTFVTSKKWSGSAWVAVGTVVDGALLVTGSVTAAKINANGLSIRKADGTLILDAGGGGLQAGFEAPGTKNIDLVPSIDAAQDAIDIISDDDWLSKAKKPELILKWDTLYAERAGILAQASALGVSSTDYNAAFNNADAFLATITPSYANLSTDSPMSGATFRLQFTGLSTYRQALLNAIAAKIQVNAAAAQASADTANNAINDATTGLAQRMRLNADNILGGIQSANVVSAPAGFRAGNVLWNAAGAWVSGSGVAMTPTGLVGYNSSGVAQFSINASTGAAVFAGALSAATGTFGAVTIASGGSISSGQTAYNTGTGFWLGSVSGTPKFSVGNSSGSNLRWDGSALLVSGQIITTSNLVDNAATETSVVTSSSMAVGNAGSTSIVNNSLFTTLATYTFTPAVTGIVLVNYLVDVEYYTTGTVTYFEVPLCRVDTGSYSASENSEPNSRTGPVLLTDATANFVVRKQLSVVSGVSTTIYFRCVARSQASYTHTAKNISMVIEVIKK